MTTYYVATNGSNYGNGSSTSPWASINHAMSQDLKPGDEVVVRPGTYKESVTIANGGSAAGDVILRSEVPGAALIRPPAGAWNAIYVWDNYVTIKGFDIGGARGDGIEGNNVHHITVQNNTIHGSGESGIQFNWSEFLKIEGNTTYGNAWSGWFSGISVYENRNISGDTTTAGYRTIIRNNVSYDNVTKEGAHTDGNGIIIDDFHNGQTTGYPNYTYPTLVENNLVYNNGGKGIAVHWSDNVTVRNNTSWHNNQDNANDGTWRGELSNQDSSNNVWVNNIAVADPAVNSNNTAIGFYGGNSNTVWLNNLTYNGKAGQASLKLEGGSNPAPSAANGNLLGVDPGFVDAANGNFNLRATSPAVNAGTGSRGVGTTDVDGDARVQGVVDIGAQEYGGTTVPAPTPNTPPAANDDFGMSTTTNKALTITTASLLANDTDADGNSLTITSVGSASRGTVTLGTNGSVIFTPEANYVGTGSFTYTASDGKGGTDTARVSIDIKAPVPTNAPPVAGDDAGFTTTSGKAITIALADLLKNDTDANGDTLTVTGVRNAVNGTVSMNGSPVFTPKAGFTGKASFTYDVSDGKGGTDSAVVSIDVTAAASTGGSTFSLWTDATKPKVASFTDSKSVELGLKFTADVDAELDGVRVYVGSSNHGIKSVSLRASDGTLLAKEDVGTISSTGWVKINFDAPVELDAGKTYVASYFTSTGRYSYTDYQFTKGYDAGPITIGANAGVYSYGSVSKMPTSSYHASNYWIDVLLDTGTSTTAAVAQAAPMQAALAAPVASSPDVIGEAGMVTVAQGSAGQWHTVTFGEALQDPSVVMSAMSSNSSEPFTIRVRNVTETGFQYQIDEWDYLNGRHGAETIGWMAVEKGVHVLADGRTIAAGTTSAGASKTTVDFGDMSFDSKPAVFAQVSSAKTGFAVNDRIESVTADGFGLRLEQQEAKVGQIARETVSWIAVEKGAGSDQSPLVGLNGSVTHRATNVAFDSPLGADTLVFLTDMQTRQQADSATVGVTGLTGTGATIRIVEESSNDAELAHLAESVAYLGLASGQIFGVSDHPIG